MGDPHLFPRKGMGRVPAGKTEGRKCRPAALRFLLAGALLAAAGAAPAAASLFGNKDLPVPQWGLDAAKTPTPAYAQDAGVVVLYDEYVETIDAQGRATERERKAFRILKPQGRGNGYCAVSYDVDEKIESLHEWTIAANGRVFPARDTDFAVYGDLHFSVVLFPAKVLVVRAPAADIGATVICESEELLSPYQQEADWIFQQDAPVVFQAMELDFPPGRSYAADWHNHEPVQPVETSPGRVRWEIRNERALDLRDIPSRPATAALHARMTVQWGQAAVEGIANQWRALGEWLTTLEAGRPDPTPEIAAETRQLIAGKTDFYGKLAAITSYIQKNIRYMVVVRGIRGILARPAAEIYRNRYGDCKDKTTLLIAMLQAAGIHGFYVPVDDRRGVVDSKDPSLIGDHMITAIEIPAGIDDPRLQAVVKTADGKRYLIFDPTNERTPVGNLPAYEQGSYGLLAAGAASQVIALPVLPPQDNGATRTGTFTLSADGTLSGSVDVSYIGPDGADFRYFIKYSAPKERRDAWAMRLGSDLPGATLDSFKFTEPGNLDKPAELQYTVTAGGYAHFAGNLLLVRPRVVSSDLQAWNDTPRTLPIELTATGRWRDDFTIALPAGYVVDELPDPVNLDAGFAGYSAKATVSGDILHYEREYVVRKVEIPAADAAEFGKLERAIGEDEQAAAVLRKQ